MKHIMFHSKQMCNLTVRKQLNYNEHLKKSAEVNQLNIIYQHVTHKNYNVNIV